MSCDAKPIDWNVYAAAYDTLLMIHPYRRMLEEVADEILIHIPDTRTIHMPILDAACGTGNLITELRRLGVRGANITGIDSAPHMLARARHKHAYAGTLFHEGNLDEILPFPSDSFAGITCTNALYATRSPVTTLRECARIVRPNGFLVLTNPHANANIGLILKAHAKSDKPDAYWERYRTNPNTARALLAEAVAMQQIPAHMLEIVFDANQTITTSTAKHFLTEDELLHAVREAGLLVHDIRKTYADQAFLCIAQRL